MIPKMTSSTESIEISIPGPWREVIVAIVFAFLIAFVTFLAIVIFRTYGQEPLGHFSKEHTEAFIGLVSLVSGGLTFAVRTTWQWTHGLLTELTGMHRVLEDINNQFTETRNSLEQVHAMISDLQSENQKRKTEAIAIFAYLEGQSGKKFSELRDRMGMAET